MASKNTPDEKSDKTNTAPTDDAGNALKQFVDDVVALTQAKADDVERFAAEYLPAYVQALQQYQSDDPATKSLGERVLGHVRAQVTLEACKYGIQLEQSMLTTLWSIFGAALKVA